MAGRESWAAVLGGDMRRYRAVLAALLLVVCQGGALESAFAFEFSVFGNTTWSYLYYSQMGRAGFFGKYDVGAASVDPALVPVPIPEGAFGVANAWLGSQVGNLVSGADASQSSLSASFFPILVVNPAITFTGQYRIGSGLTEAGPGVSSIYGVGQWTMWNVTINNPVGTILYGKKPFTAGMGLQFDGAANRSEESLVLQTDYGPLIIGAAFYPWRTETTTYYNGTDKSGANVIDCSSWVTYAVGPAKAGAGIRFSKFHQGPESQPIQFDKIRFPTIDTHSSEGWLYFKYNNGRFFFNAEADFWFRTDRHQVSQFGTFYFTPDNTDGSGSLFAPQFVESWRYGLEFGALCGPAKVTFLYSWLPGPDRRHGVLIDRQPVVVNQLNRAVIGYDPDRANVSVFRPYSMLLSSAYGSGVNAFSRANTGYMVDASIIAARADYSVAANLQTYCSLLYATRVSHGYGWGYIRPDSTTKGPFVTPLIPAERGPNGNIQYGIRGTFAAPSPAIPDNGLGWEINAGLSWQLLDSWTLNVAAGYWKPGKWFSFACVDKGTANWLDPSPSNFWGTNPGREIDGIFGLDVAASLDF